MGSTVQAWITKLLKLVLIGFSCLMVIGAGLNSWLLLKEQVGTDRWHLVVSWCLLLALIAICTWLLVKIPDRPINNWVIVTLLLIVFAGLFLVWIYQTPTRQVSDYYKFWDMGAQAVQGHSIYHTDNSYFSKWAYQTGFLVYVMGFIKLFGVNLRLFQWFTVVQQVVVLALTYVLAQKLFHQVTISRLSVFFIGINLEWWALNNRVTSQYLALIFFLLTFILLIDAKPFHWLAAGICLALGNVLRPLGIVFVAGIVVFWLIYRLWSAQSNWKSSIAQLLGLVAVYFLLLASLGSAIKLSGLNAYGLSNRDSEWKFVMGLNYPSSGTYSNEVRNKFDLSDSRQVMLKKEQQVTRQHVNYLNQHHLWLKLFVKKFDVLWSSPSNTLYFSLFNQNHTARHTWWVTIIAYGISVIEMGLVLLGAVVLWFKQPSNSHFNLLLLVLFAYVCAQLIIEVQGRYRLEFVPVLALIASVGVDKFWQGIREMRCTN